MPDPQTNTVAAVVLRAPFWKSKSLFAAAAMTLIGLITWLRQPAPPESTASPQPASASESQTARPSAIRSRPPAAFRFGASYIGGFFIGWGFRKSLKLALFISGTALAAISLAKWMGLIDLDWSAAEGNVSQGLFWVRGEAGAIKTLLTGYLPSATATMVGAFMGARRR
jgi:uncharacterized membrane protein (Fun14 family)